MDRFKIIEKKELEKLPKTTGVYCFIEETAESRSPLIYIGKAINIQSRVKNHFQQPSYRDNLFIDKVDKIGYLETNNSEIEALILEANLIKKYQPKYNVMWRDDKSYFWVAIFKNKNGAPYILITHQPQKLQTPNSKLQTNLKTQNLKFKTEYIGPFVEGTALKKTLRFLRRVFPYYTSAKHSKNKCAYCHLDLCPGPYENLAALRNELRASSALDEYRKNIEKIILILKGKRNTVLNSLKEEMRQLSKKNKFEEAGNVRDKIYALQQVMSHTHVINTSNVGKAQIRHSLAIAELRRILNLENISRIECYDISNIQGKQATGSMVVFVNGKPDKNLYRKFKIKTIDTPNDIAMIKEVLERRFAHPEWKYPEMILIDGGKAQLNIAIKTKNEVKKESLTLSLRSYSQSQNFKNIKNIKIISIAKGKQELFIEGQEKPTPLKQLPQKVYNLIKQLDDEAHRFAIAYHKKLREKYLLN